MLDSILHVQYHVEYVHSQALRILGLVRYVTYRPNFSSPNSLIVLHNALIMSKLEYASVVWNNLTLTNSNTENLPLCVVIVSYTLRHYNLILNCLHAMTLYSR